jgi:hypothetical protein
MKKSILGFAISLILIAACNSNQNKSTDAGIDKKNSKVYFNGDIITMEGDSPSLECWLP